MICPSCGEYTSWSTCTTCGEPMPNKPEEPRQVGYVQPIPTPAGMSGKWEGVYDWGVPNLPKVVFGVEFSKL